MRTFSIDPVKLDRYRAEAETAFAGAREAASSLRHEIVSLETIESAVRLRKMAGGGELGEPTIPELEKMDKAKREIARLKEASNAASLRAQHCGAVAGRVEEYAEPFLREMEAKARRAVAAGDEARLERRQEERRWVKTKLNEGGLLSNALTDEQKTAINLGARK